MNTTRYTFDENPTVFGKILRGEIPARVVYETDTVLAFHNIAPKAPVHVLIIPKPHLVSMQVVNEADKDLMGELMVAANVVADKLGVRENGYRLYTNAGKAACQEVPHLHIHLVATGADGTLEEW